MNRLTLALGLSALAVAVPTAAHHSFDGSFDRNKLVQLSGRVTEYQFGNPHTYFKLEVTEPGGRTKVWRVETTSAGGLAAHGWNAHSLSTGEHLKVEAWPARDGSAYARLRDMTHADGTTIALWMPPGPSPLPGA